MELYVFLLLKCLVGFVLGKAVHKDPAATSTSSSCSSPIGIQTGFLETRDIKTSTSQKDFTATDPWCATKQDVAQFMAVDLGENFKLTKVATLGKADDQNRFVKEYALEYSSDGSKWQEYKDVTGKRELIGNENTFAVKSNPLTPNIEARYVKLKPLNWSAGGICTSFDLFGCSVDELNKSKKS